jgi:hypothetical protein
MIDKIGPTADYSGQMVIVGKRWSKENVWTIKWYEDISVVTIILEIVRSAVYSALFFHGARNTSIGLLAVSCFPTTTKDHRDARCPANYRPVSNLAFVSKLLERVVQWQLHAGFLESIRCDAEIPICLPQISQHGNGATEGLERPVICL